MLQGSGAMPTLVVEEGLVPFASGETPTATLALWPTETPEARPSPRFPPKLAASFPRWHCRAQWDHLRVLRGSPFIPTPSCRQQMCLPLHGAGLRSPAQEVP